MTCHLTSHSNVRMHCKYLQESTGASPLYAASLLLSSMLAVGVSHYYDLLTLRLLAFATNTAMHVALPRDGSRPASVWIINPNGLRTAYLLVSGTRQDAHCSRISRAKFNVIRAALPMPGHSFIDLRNQ